MLCSPSFLQQLFISVPPHRPGPFIRQHRFESPSQGLRCHLSQSKRSMSSESEKQNQQSKWLLMSIQGDWHLCRFGGSFKIILFIYLNKKPLFPHRKTCFIIQNLFDKVILKIEYLIRKRWEQYLIQIKWKKIKLSTMMFFCKFPAIKFPLFWQHIDGKK